MNEQIIVGVLYIVFPSALFFSLWYFGGYRYNKDSFEAKKND